MIITIRSTRPRHEPPPMLVDMSVSTWIEKAWLPCWPLYSQQVSHQRWVWGSHKWDPPLPPGPGKGYPPPGKGVPPTWTWKGVPPVQTWEGVPPPGPGRGYPPPQSRPGKGVPPGSRMGNPPPPTNGWQSENITSSRTTYAVGNKYFANTRTQLCFEYLRSIFGSVAVLRVYIRQQYWPKNNFNFPK